MTRGKQIIEEAKRIIAEAHERGYNDPMVDLAITLSFTLGARWADKNPHWISVEDKLPEEYIQVLCHGYNRQCRLDKGYIFTTCRVYKRDDYKRDGNGFEITDIPSAFSRVTHWMPLPPPPHHIIDVNKKVKKGGEG